MMLSLLIMQKHTEVVQQILEISSRMLPNVAALQQTYTTALETPPCCLPAVQSTICAQCTASDTCKRQHQRYDCTAGKFTRVTLDRYTRAFQFSRSSTNCESYFSTSSYSPAYTAIKQRNMANPIFFHSLLLRF